MTSINPSSVVFGNRLEWRTFAERRPLFLERFENLKRALDAAYIRTLTNAGKLESMIFFTSRQCADDFMEIMLVCGNGEGNAGEKLLRSLYERVVLVAYLHKFPDQIDAYFEYYHVTSKKVLDAARYLWGDEAASPARIREIEENYERVKNSYRNRTCPKCGRKESGMSWTPVAFFDMAKAVGLDRYAFYAYTMPLLQAHPSVKGTLGRLDGEPEGPISWGERVDREKADRVLMTAHALLLHLFDVQLERFQIEGLDSLARTAAEDWKPIWDGAESTSAQA